MLGHVANGYFFTGMYIETRTVQFALYNIIYSFHMPLFFSISGYLFCVAYFDSNWMPDKRRITRQTLNLLIIYLDFSIFKGIAEISVSRFFPGTMDSVPSIWDILLIPFKPIALYWYLYVLVIFYQFFSLRKLNSMSAWAVALGLGIASVIGGFVYVSYFAIHTVLYYALFFYLGILHRRRGIPIIWDKAVMATGVLTAIVLCCMCWSEQNQLISAIPIVNTITALGFCLGIWYAFEHIHWLGNNTFLQLLGRYSLEIYLIHQFITVGLRVALPWLGITNAYINILLNLCISIMIPVLFALICKCLGIHELLFRPMTFITRRKVADA